MPDKNKNLEFYKQKEKEREETRKNLPPEKQLEFPTEKPEKKLGVPPQEILKLRKSEKSRDQYLIESIRQRVKQKLDKEISKEDIEKLKNLETLAEKEKEQLILGIRLILFYEKGMNDPDSDVRQNTARSLGELAKIAPEKYIPLYEKGINDPDVFVREGTARSLGELAKIAPEKAIPFYKKGMNNPDNFVRQGTARSLGELAKIAPGKYIPLYEKGINDEWNVKFATAQSLSELLKVAPETAIPLYEKGMNNPDNYVREGTARSLGELVKIAPEKAIPLYEKGMDNPDDSVRRGTARSLGELVKIAPEKYILLYEKGINDPDFAVRQNTARSLGELAKIAPEKYIPLYEKGMIDPDDYVKEGTARALGELVKVAPEKAIPLYEKGMNNPDDSVRRGTAESLGELAKVIDFKPLEPIEKVLKEKYQIPETEMNYVLNVLAFLMEDNKDLGELVLKYLPEYQTIKEFSKEINSKLPLDKKTADVEKFWQKNQIELGTLQTFDLNLSTQLIRENLKLFGFPRLENLLHTAGSVLADRENRESLKKIIPKLKNLDGEGFSRLMHLTDAFTRLGFKNLFQQEIEYLAQKEELSSKEAIAYLGEKILFQFAQKLGIQTELIQGNINRWNLEYLAKLFEAEKLFKEEDKELLKLIVKATFQEKEFTVILFGNYEGKYTPEEEEWLEQIKNYTKKVQKEFQKAGIDFHRWLNYDKRKEVFVGETPSAQSEKKEAFNRELYETITSLLGSYREKRKGILPDDKAKQVFNSVFKKYGLQFKDKELYRSQKGKLNFREIDDVLGNFILTVERIFNEEKDKAIQEQIGTALSHLQDLKSRLPELERELNRQGYSLSIRPWQRNPGYDIFQGNYTGCCIAVENFNRGAILDYLIDAGLQIVEVRDENVDETIAQTFLYFAKDNVNNINLVLDNVEIHKDRLGLAEVIRENLFNYLKEYSLAVCPKTKRIVLGATYNDVKTKDLQNVDLTLRKIGGSPRQTEYLDSFGSARVDPSEGINETFHLIAEDFQNEKTPSRKEKEERYLIRTLESLNEDTLREILSVEQASFPEEMQSDLEDLREALENPKGIQLIAQNTKGEIVSYLSSQPLEDVYAELKDYDPALQADPHTLYVESIATKPESRDIGIFLRTLNRLKDEAKAKGYSKIAAHVRVSNHLSDVLQKRGARKLRTIENWHDFGEPFDYVEIEI